MIVSAETLEWSLLTGLVILVLCACVAWHERDERPGALTVAGVLAAFGIVASLLWSVAWAPVLFGSAAVSGPRQERSK